MKVLFHGLLPTCRGYGYGSWCCCCCQCCRYCCCSSSCCCCRRLRYACLHDCCCWPRIMLVQSISPKAQANAALPSEAYHGYCTKSQVLTFMGDAPNPEGKPVDKPSSVQQARGSTSRGEAIGSGSGNGDGIATSASPPWFPEDGFRLQGLQSSEPLRSSRVSDKHIVSEAPPCEVPWVRGLLRRPRVWFRAGVATPATRAAVVPVVGEAGSESGPDVSMKLPKPVKPAAVSFTSCNSAAGVASFTSTHLPASLCDEKSMRTASEATEP